MAALWVVGGVMVGVLATYLVMTNRQATTSTAELSEALAAQVPIMAELRAARAELAEARAQLDGGLMGAGDPPWVRELLTRLLDAALPTAQPAHEQVERMPTPTEYEPPPPEVHDWTDPFFGLERETVGRLAPGQGIPGIGTDAGPVEYDPADFPNNLDSHPLARGFEDADSEDQVGRWQDVGEEVGEAWLESRER